MKRVKFKLEFEIDDITQEDIVNRLFNNHLGEKGVPPRLKLDELMVSSIRNESSNLWQQLEVILLPGGKLELIEYSRAKQFQPNVQDEK